MRIIFRADASKDKGAGHVMRSSVLAEEAILRGFECVFVGEISGLDWVRKRIDSLPFSEKYFEGIENLAFSKEDTLVVDSYEMPKSSQFRDPKKWRNIISIADEVTPDFSANLIISQSALPLTGTSLSPKVLSGPRYLLLRKGVSKSSRVWKPSEPLNVVIIGGGSDPFGFCQGFSQIIPGLNIESNVDFHFFSPSLLTNVTRENVRITTHELGIGLDQILETADLAFTLASTTSFELLARNIPIGIAAAVYNQNRNYSQFLAANLAKSIGIMEEPKRWRFDTEVIEDLLNVPESRSALTNHEISQNAYNGASEVMDVIVTLIQ